MNVDTYDLVVVGGGMGGLSLAALAQRSGRRVALLEAHTHLGGCAGWFERGPYTFDAGATALMGLEVGEPLGELLNAIGLDFQGTKTPAYRVCLPDRELRIVPQTSEFEAAIEAVFPGQSGAKRRFWRWQAAIGQELFRVAGKGTRLPWSSLADIFHDLNVLGPRGAAAASSCLLTVQNVLQLLGLANDRPFRALIAMLLQDTAQAGPEIVPFANASACLQAYRIGMSRPQGGMRALAEGIGQRFAALGGDLRTGTLVDRVEEQANAGNTPRFVVQTRRRQRFLAREVAFNLPIDLAVQLLGRSLDRRLARCEAGSRARWSAFTGYLAVDRTSVPDDAPLFHQVLQDYNSPIHDGNNVLISLSPLEDPGYGPPDVRVATLSTHVRPMDWQNLTGEEYQKRKTEFENRLLGALGRALPEAPASLRHSEFASPRSFVRYTRRNNGAVGGPPVSRRNSNLLAVGADILGPGLWLVGDSVFPGQGTMAVVLSARRVLEQLGKSVPPTPAAHQ